jgi:hypothetical protein
MGYLLPAPQTEARSRRDSNTAGAGTEDGMRFKSALLGILGILGAAALAWPR